MVLCPKGRAGPAAPEQPGNKEQLVFSHSINSLASLLRPQQRDNYCSGLVGEGSGPELHRQKPLLVLDWGKSGDIKIFLKIQIYFFSSQNAACKLCKDRENPSLELLPHVRAGIAALAEHSAHKSPGFSVGFSIPPISSKHSGHSAQLNAVRAGVS